MQGPIGTWDLLALIKIRKYTDRVHKCTMFWLVPSYCDVECIRKHDNMIFNVRIILILKPHFCQKCRQDCYQNRSPKLGVTGNVAPKCFETCQSVVLFRRCSEANPVSVSISASSSVLLGKSGRSFWS